MAHKSLRRDQNNKIVAGVCAGIGNYFGWSHSNVRLFYILLSVLSAAFPGMLVYILLWIFMPAN